MFLFFFHEIKIEIEKGWKSWIINLFLYHPQCLIWYSNIAPLVAPRWKTRKRRQEGFPKTQPRWHLLIFSDWVSGFSVLFTPPLLNRRRSLTDLGVSARLVMVNTPNVKTGSLSQYSFSPSFYTRRVGKEKKCYVKERSSIFQGSVRNHGRVESGGGEDEHWK